MRNVVNIHVDGSDAGGAIVTIDATVADRHFIIGPSKQFLSSFSESKDLIWYFEQYPLYPIVSAVESCQRIEQGIDEWGKKQFMRLFLWSDAHRELWERISPYLQDTWFNINTVSTRWVRIPWEAMKSPDAPAPLSTLARSFTRSLCPTRNPEVASSPFRLLVAISRPMGRLDVPYNSIANSILWATEGIAGVHVLRPPTYEALLDCLHTANMAGRPFTAVHLDGHGAYSALPGTKRKRGYFLFEGADAGSSAECIHGAMLGRDLIRHGCKVLALNACRSSFWDERPEERMREEAPEATASIAGEAIREGVSAVAAMAYNVLVDGARLFYRDFYSLLCNGCSLGEATARSREVLFNHANRNAVGASIKLADWLIPVAWENEQIQFVRQARTCVVKKAGARQDDCDGLGDGVVAEIERQFRNSKVIALEGFSGAGKSTILKSFARWFVLSRPSIKSKVLCCTTGDIRRASSLQAAFRHFESGKHAAWNNIVKYRGDLLLLIDGMLEGDGGILTELQELLNAGELRSNYRVLIAREPGSPIPDVARIRCQLTSADLLRSAAKLTKRLTNVEVLREIVDSSRGNLGAAVEAIGAAERAIGNKLTFSAPAWFRGDLCDEPGTDTVSWKLRRRFEQLPEKEKKQLLPLLLMGGTTSVAFTSAYYAGLVHHGVCKEEASDAIATGLRVGLLACEGEVVELHPLVAHALIGNDHRDLYVETFCRTAALLANALREKKQKGLSAYRMFARIDAANFEFALQRAGGRGLWAEAGALLNAMSVIYAEQRSSQEWAELGETLIDQPIQNEEDKALYYDPVLAVLNRQESSEPGPRPVPKSGAKLSQDILKSNSSAQDLLLLGKEQLARGDKAALITLERAREKSHLEACSVEIVASILFYLGHVHLRLYRAPEKAAELYCFCKKLVPREHELNGKAAAQLGQVKYELFKIGYFRGTVDNELMLEAISLIEESLTFVAETDLLTIGRRSMMLARIFSEQSEYERSREYFQKAHDCFLGIGEQGLLLNSYMQYASMLSDEGKSTEARVFAKRASDIARSGGFDAAVIKNCDRLMRSFGTGQ